MTERENEYQQSLREILSETWLTTAQLVERGVSSASKVRSHVDTLKQLGLAKRVGSTRRGQWLFAPEALGWLKDDQRANRGYKVLTPEQEPQVKEAWLTYKSVNGVAKALKVGWYTAARWLDQLDLRPLAEGTMTNYVSRGKGDD